MMYEEENLKQILSVVTRAVVFIDTNVAECFHWYKNGYKKLLTAGALKVKSIPCEEKDCLESETKAVFIISSALSGSISTEIENIVRTNDFEHCTVVTSISPALQEFIGSYANAQAKNSSGNFSRNLKIWMGNDFATANVIHVPMFQAHILPDLFVTPCTHDLFPMLPSDVARLQAFLHSKGDKRAFDNLGDVDFSILPKNLQIKIKTLASSFNDMFETLSIHEDCYGVGHCSKMVASELANLPNAKARRKMAKRRASIVFVDRTLDLVGPTSFASENLLDMIMEILFKLPYHHNDVAIDMKLLFQNGNLTPDTLLPGCLAHTSDPLVEEILNSFTMEQTKDAIKIIQEKMKFILRKENINYELQEEKPSLERFLQLLGYFRGNMKLFEKYSGISQYALAVINTLSDADQAHRDEMLSAEKVMMLEFHAKQSKVLSNILSLLTKHSTRFSVIDCLLLCLHFYSAVDRTVNINPADEERIKEAIMGVLLDGTHDDDLLFLFGHCNPSERELRFRISDIFERLRGISTARNEQKQIWSVCSEESAGQSSYTPVTSQIMELIYDPRKPELIDVEFRSHGLKDFLKTGFGLFMNVNKPRPDDHNLLYLFVIGGITFNEVRKIRNTVKRLNPSAEVVIGSTRIISPTEVLEQVLCTENLFVDIT